MPKLIFAVTEDRYFVSHRLHLALAAQRQGYEVAVVTRISRHRQALESLGLKVIPLEWQRAGLNPLTALREALSLARIYLRERPDLVHHVALRPVVVGAVAARIARVRKVVSAVTGLGFLFGAGRQSRTGTSIKKVLPFLLSRGLVIVQNANDRDFLQGLGVRGSRLRLIAGSGVDVELFRPGKPPEGSPVVMLASRLLWDKGVGEFVGAARQLKGQARFVLVGEPDTVNPAVVPKAQIEDWVREGAIEWWGMREDMPDVLREAEIFCLPSYHEGLPKALLEAMATGLACITTDIPGCRDAIEHGTSGLLIPERDSRALADAIACLLSDATLRARLGQAARQRVIERFAVDRIVDETLKVYGELMSAGTPNSSSKLG